MIQKNLASKKTLMLYFIVTLILTSCTFLSKPKDTISKVGLEDLQRTGNGVGFLNPPLKPYWEIRVSKRFKLNPFSKMTQHSYPAVSKDIAYVGSVDNLFFAFDMKEKKILWEFKTTGPVESSPTIQGGRVFFGTTDGKIYSLKRDGGKEEWSFQATAPILASPLIVNDKVVIKTIDGRVYALDIQSGKKLWQYLTDIKERLHGRDYTSPAYFNGKIFISFSDGSLVALRANDGTEVFKIEVERTDNVFSPGQPVVDSGLIYIRSPEGSLFVFDEDGREKWYLDEVRVSSFVVTKNIILLMDTEGFVTALNKITGERLWRRRVSRGKAVGGAVTDNLLITTSRYISTLFDIEWLSTTGGYIDIFDLKDGRRLWSYKVESGISSPPIVVGDKILFLTDKGFLHIFKSS